MAPACPRGLDCALHNSCPAYFVDCPTGFFCSSYMGFPDLAEMDYQYAKMKWQYADVDVTYDNAFLWADGARAIQTRCLNGFFCETGRNMTVCPSGYWCSEATVKPRKCGQLSFCPENSHYELNLTNVLIGVVAATLLLILSSWALNRQRRREELCRNMQQLNNAKEVQSPLLKNHAALSGSIGVQLQDVKYTFDSGRRVIVSDFTATVPPGKTTLLLGPTGCGKTTVLNIIRSGAKRKLARGCVHFTLHKPNEASIISPNGLKNDDGQTAEGAALHSPLLSSGTTDIDVSPLNTQNLADYIGLVPQDDVLDRKLTVREQLLFHLQTRAKQVVHAEQAQLVVEKTLQDLGILHIADAIIGGGENLAANISGGQLKRVNIACELVAITAPAVLLLDEPTSGLDAAVASELIDCIDALKVTQGITILCVLQQPRHEIFAKMDHLLLMHPAGRLVYEGSVNSVNNFLTTQLGYSPYSAETSDADFCIDVLNDMRNIQQRRSLFQEKASQPGRNSCHSAKYLALSDTGDLDLDVETNDIETDIYLEEVQVSQPPLFERFWTDLVSSARKAKLAVSHERFYRQVYLQLQRLVTVRLRGRLQLIIYMAINIIMAVSLSSGFSIFFVGSSSYTSVLSPPAREELQSYYPGPLSTSSSRNVNQLSLNQLLFFMCGALGCASCLAAIPVFSGLHEIAQRENSTGTSLISFGLGRMIGDLPFIAINASVFCATWCAFGMPGRAQDWFITILATAFASSSIGYLSSTLTDAKHADVVAIISTFLCCVFSGSEPTLNQVDRYPVISYPWYLSFGTWTSEATYVTWSRYLHDDGVVPEPVQEGANYYGYDVSHGLSRSISALFALGIAMRLLVLFFLMRSKSS